MKKEPDKGEAKIKDLPAKKLSVQEEAAVKGGVLGKRDYADKFP